MKDIEDFACGYIDTMEELEGKIVTIDDVFNDYVCIEESYHNWDKRAFEPVETQEENYIKNDVEQTKSVGDIIKNLFDEALNVIKENPYLIQQLNESFKKIQNENEKLKEYNHNQELQIEYLKGQISVYEKLLKEEN